MQSFVIIISSWVTLAVGVLFTPPTFAIPTGVESDFLLQVRSFKKHHTPTELRSNHTLLKKFSALHARAYGLTLKTPKDTIEEALDRSPELSKALTPKQHAAWQELLELGWKAHVDWDPLNGAPVAIKPGLLFEGITAEHAQGQFERQFTPILQDLFRLSALDKLQVLDQRDFELPQPHGKGQPVRVRQIRYEHHYNELPVFGDRLIVTLLKREFSDHWTAMVQARWTPGGLSSSPTFSKEDVFAQLKHKFGASEVQLQSSPTLGYLPIDAQGQLAWDVRYRLDGVPERVVISALDGSLLDSQSLVAADHSGVVNGWTTRPHLDAPEVRPMPFLNLYEDSVTMPTQASCYFTPSFDEQVIADRAKLNATTNYDGEYSTSSHSDLFDLSWATDFQGPFANDISPYENRVVEGVVAGTEYDIPQVTADGVNRRAQLFYLTNYAARLYDAYAIPQYKPIGFHFSALGSENVVDTACQDDDIQTSCCSGSSEAGCFWLECDMGPTGSPAAERRFREVAAHEQVHTLAFFANGGALCSGCGGSPNADGAECACWEEGRADFGAIAMNQFEKHRQDFRPDLTYPQDWDSGLYSSGAIFTALYIDYMLRAGLEGMMDVQRNLDLVDSDTRMVGLCGSDISACPVNSFYRQLINNRDQWAFPRWRNSQEISAVFHDHVTDADRGLAGTQTFPWADEIQNRVFNPPLLYTDLEASSTVTASEGNDGGGNIRLNDDDDWDTVMFLARSGESYTVRTNNLAPGVDTRLEVRTIDANESYLVGENDDCGAGPDSCFSFVATETSMHRVFVTSQPGTLTGQEATYGISVDLDDDAGDDLPEASTIAADDLMHTAHGMLEATTDVDVYRLVVPTPQMLGYSACSTNEAFKVNIEIVDSLGAVVSSSQNRKCDKSPKLKAVDVGTYYLRVFAKSGDIGSYGLRVSLETTDLDADDLPLNAHTVTPDVGIGTLFESTDDEDWYRINALQGRHYSVEVVAVDTDVDPVLEVYAPGNTMYAPPQLPDTSGHVLGHWMMRNDNGGLRGNDARSIFWAPVSGEYLLRVVPKAGSGAGRYHLLTHDNSGYTEGYPEYP